MQIKIDGVAYLGHRLAWLYVTGKWPKLIDHKNRKRADNRFDNLRDALNQHNNCMNVLRPRFANTVDANIYFKSDARRRKPYIVCFGSGKHRRAFGHFATIEEARKARDKAAKNIRGEYAPT